ncbi:MAG: DUF2141 domain-containing protein [Proteobacteria bacterium]|nr:DUF2141 domain-containing protein [Pseudomonadota bacterium]
MNAPWAVSLALLAVLSSGSRAGGSPSQRSPRRRATGDVIVVVTGLRHDGGKVLVGLYRGEAGFPADGRAASARAEVTIVRGTARVRFSAVPVGTLAVGVLHDEDGDRAMDTGLFGLPQEGYGVSRDAVRAFGPPRYRDAALRLAAGEHKLVRIPIHY